jgi:hypothetical protein
MPRQGRVTAATRGGGDGKGLDFMFRKNRNRQVGTVTTQALSIDGPATRESVLRKKKGGGIRHPPLLRLLLLESSAPASAPDTSLETRKKRINFTFDRKSVDICAECRKCARGLPSSL